MPKLWSTPAHRPDRSVAWPLSFYNLRVDGLPAVTSGPRSTWVAEQAELQSAAFPAKSDFIKSTPYRTDFWSGQYNTGLDILNVWGVGTFTNAPGADYFVDGWPMDPVTNEPLIPYNRPVWAVTNDPLYGDNQYPYDNRHLWFDSLRSENSRLRLDDNTFCEDLNLQTLGDRHVILWSEATNELVEGAGYTDYYTPGVFPPIQAPSPTPSCLSATTFDISNYVLPLTAAGRPCGQTAARLPIAPFFFTYADIVEAKAGNGDLGHMLGWTAHDYRQDWQWPARATDGINATGLPAGSVIRLKPDAQLSYNPANLSADERVIVRTLQRYGMCLYDKNYSSANIAMPCDSQWPSYPNQIDLTDTLRLSDFELVDISPFRYDSTNPNNIRVGSAAPSSLSITASKTSQSSYTASFSSSASGGAGPYNYFWDFEDPQFQKMIVIGDSISAWGSATGAAPGNPPWPYPYTPSDRWHDLLVNRGFVGTRLDGTYPGYNTLQAAYYPKLAAGQSADLTIIYLGANDQQQSASVPSYEWVTPSQYGGNLRYLLSAYPAPVKMLIFPWKWNANLADPVFNDPATNAARREQYRAVAEETASLTPGCLFLDMGLTFDGAVGSGIPVNAPTTPLHPYLIDPLIHSSAYGHEITANLVQSLLGGTPKSHTFSTSGTYSVTASVMDADLNVATSSPIVVTVTNARPTASFTKDVSSGIAPKTVNFTDTSTAVSGTTISTRNWNFGDGNTSTATNPSHVYSSAGTYTVTLSVTDSNGATDVSDPQTVTVSARIGPTANFSSDFSSGAAPLTVSFLDESIEGNVAITEWSWDFADGSSPVTAQNPTHTFTAFGTKNVNLTVTDSDGYSSTFTSPITIFNGRDPFAYFDTAPTAAFGTTEVSFDPSLSDIPNGISLAEWVFDDGNSVDKTTLEIVEHTYTGTNVYFPTVLLTDNAPGVQDGWESKVSIREDVDRTEPGTNGVVTNLPIVSDRGTFGLISSGTYSLELYRSDLFRFPTPSSYTAAWFTPEAAGNWGSVTIKVSNPSDSPVSYRAHVIEAPSSFYNIGPSSVLNDFEQIASVPDENVNGTAVFTHGGYSYTYSSYVKTTAGVSYEQGRLSQFDSSLTLLHEVDCPRLDQFRDLKIDDTGNLWVLGFQSIGSPETKGVWVFNVVDMSVIYKVDLPYASTVSFDGDGNAWLDGAGNLYKVSTTTYAVLETISIATYVPGFQYSNGLACSRTNNKIYVIVTILNVSETYQNIIEFGTDGLPTGKPCPSYRYLLRPIYDEDTDSLFVIEDSSSGRKAKKILCSTMVVDPSFEEQSVNSTISVLFIGIFIVGEQLIIHDGPVEISYHNKKTGLIQYLGFLNSVPGSAGPSYDYSFLKSVCVDIDGTVVTSSGASIGFGGRLSSWQISNPPPPTPGGLWTDDGIATTITGPVPYDPDDGTYFELAANSSGTVTYAANSSVTAGPGDWGPVVVAGSAVQRAGNTIDAVIFGDGSPFNRPPVAVLTATPDSGNAPLLVTLDGRGSSDPDSNLDSATWDFGDGNSLNIQGSTLIDGYDITLSDGSITETSSQNFVSPVQIIDAGIESAISGIELAFSGSGGNFLTSVLQINFYASSGDVIFVELPYADIALLSNFDVLHLTVSHTYASEGSYTASLTLTDLEGLSDTATVVITVSCLGDVTAVFTHEVCAGTTVIDFDASASTASIGSITSYSWDFGDGTTATSSVPTISHDYIFPGTYSVTLTVTNSSS